MYIYYVILNEVKNLLNEVKNLLNEVKNLLNEDPSLTLRMTVRQAGDDGSSCPT